MVLTCSVTPELKAEFLAACAKAGFETTAFMTPDGEFFLAAPKLSDGAKEVFKP